MDKDNNNEKLPIFSIFDNETGELVDNIFEGGGYRVYTPEEEEYKRSHKRLRKLKSFSTIDDKVANLLAKENFTRNETKLFFAIKSRVGYFEQSGMIVKKNGVNCAESMNSLEIGEVCNLNEPSIGRAAKGLEDKKIIFVDRSKKSNVYYANPFIFRNGDVITIKLYNLFKNTKWNVYNE